ncbi:MAG: hypothetical protein AAF690_20750 [Acidobacteriota bacterium]
MTIAVPLDGLEAVATEDLPERLTEVLHEVNATLSELSDPLVRSVVVGGHRAVFQGLHDALTEALDLIEDAGHLDISLSLRSSQLVQRFSNLDCDGSFVSHRALDAAFAYLGCAQRLSEALALDVVDHDRLRNEALRRKSRRLRLSLRLRREFADFRRSLARAAELPSVAQRLRYTASALATLLGRGTELSLRDADAYVLRSLQERIRQTLKETSLDSDSEDVKRLLVDVASAGAILMEINYREELCLHDNGVAESLPAELPKEQSCAFKAEVAVLYGLVHAADGDLAARSDLSPNLYDALLAAARR